MHAHSWKKNIEHKRRLPLKRNLLDKLFLFINNCTLYRLQAQIDRITKQTEIIRNKVENINNWQPPENKLMPTQVSNINPVCYKILYVCLCEVD